ncbi:hypothetical protein LK518_22685, partial [Parabacteroides distasonis]|uniref:hypothetical protein n=1 Tax=Parabacteroides distasonis TaxID=823 RepID=UPI001D116728
ANKDAHPDITPKPQHTKKNHTPNKYKTTQKRSSTPTCALPQEVQNNRQTQNTDAPHKQTNAKRRHITPLKTNTQTSINKHAMNTTDK